MSQSANPDRIDFAYPAEINCQHYIKIEEKGAMTIYHRCEKPWTAITWNSETDKTTFTCSDHV